MTSKVTIQKRDNDVFGSENKRFFIMNSIKLSEEYRTAIFVPDDY